MLKWKYAQKNLSTEKEKKKKKAWFSRPDEEGWWQKGFEKKKSEGKKEIGCIVQKTKD